MLEITSHVKLGCIRVHGRSVGPRDLTILESGEDFHPGRHIDKERRAHRHQIIISPHARRRNTFRPLLLSQAPVLHSDLPVPAGVAVIILAAVTESPET